MNAGLRVANQNRIGLAELRTRLRAGDEDMIDVLRRREPLCANMALVDVVRLKRQQRIKTGQSLIDLGRAATTANINLLVPLGKASRHSIEWLVDYIDDHPRVIGNRRAGR